jgi:dCTP deaminase
VILTGPEIRRAVRAGDITIEPFDAARVSPNAYDWRLGDTIQVCDGDLDAARPSTFVERRIPPEGMLLVPQTLYLGVTHERTQSDRYAQLINGNRTIGMLGVWVHVSAPLGHTGHAIRWTLEICVARPTHVYPRMTFGKIVFLRNKGAIVSYRDIGLKYGASHGIDASRLYEEMR